MDAQMCEQVNAKLGIDTVPPCSDESIKEGLHNTRRGVR